MAETVITVEHLYKEYMLGVISHGTLYRDLQSWWARVRGKEDPNSLISHAHTERMEQDSFLALEDVSFEVKQGDRVGIIGKNGAGKSTLLKILSRVTSPTKGRATIKGRVGSLLEVGTGFHSELTGRENIYLNGAILGMSRSEISKKIDEIIDFAGIEKHIDTPVKRFSSGMSVRLGFAVAAHLDTDILIADEVLAVGDAEFQKKAIGKMQDLSTGEGRTVLFVSHSMGTILQLCPSAILLREGRIADMGTSAHVVENYLEINKNAVLKVNRGNEKKSMYIKELFTCDSSGNEKINFAFSEDIHLRIKVVINEYDTTQKISLALLSTKKERVFSNFKYFESFYDREKSDVAIDFILKGSFIAPSDYSFLIAIDNRLGSVTYDYFDDVCPLHIYDDGTDYAPWEGVHYGYFIMSDECEWKVVG
jgi:lipopolysaccharide transport system ATP-binding protein